MSSVPFAYLTQSQVSCILLNNSVCHLTKYMPVTVGLHTLLSHAAVFASSCPLSTDSWKGWGKKEVWDGTWSSMLSRSKRLKDREGVPFLVLSSGVARSSPARNHKSIHSIIQTTNTSRVHCAPGRF